MHFVSFVGCEWNSLQCFAPCNDKIEFLSFTFWIEFEIFVSYILGAKFVSVVYVKKF